MHQGELELAGSVAELLDHKTCPELPPKEALLHAYLLCRGRPLRFARRRDDGERKARSIETNLQGGVGLAPDMGPALRLDAGRVRAEQPGLSRLVVPPG